MLSECYCSSAVWAGVYLHLLPGGGSSYYAQKQQTALYFVFYLMEAFSGMCFLFGFFLSFFPQGGFWRGFFPWTCWPHVLNKPVLCWLIPVIRNVCFCVIWTSCLILLCSLYSTSARCPFLHVAHSARCPIPAPPHFCTLPNPILKCNGLSVRCMQSVNESLHYYHNNKI